MDFDVFTVFRDRQITNRMLSEKGEGDAFSRGEIIRRELVDRFPAGKTRAEPFALRGGPPLSPASKRNGR